MTAAAALLAYENPADAGVGEVHFVKRAPDRTRTVTVASGHGSIVTGCQFSGTRKRARDQRIIVGDCEFEIEVFTLIEQRKGVPHKDGAEL